MTLIFCRIYSFTCNKNDDTETIDAFLTDDEFPLIEEHQFLGNDKYHLVKSGESNNVLETLIRLKFHIHELKKENVVLTFAPVIDSKYTYDICFEGINTTLVLFEEDRMAIDTIVELRKNK